MAPLVAALLKLAPEIIMALVKAVEFIYADEPKSGEQKKNLVMETFQSFAEVAAGVLTGGAAETWERIRDSASIIVDASASIAFPHEPGDLNAMGEGH